MKMVSFKSEVHHVFKHTLTKWKPINRSLKGEVLFMKKSHDQGAVHKEGPKVYSGLLFLTCLKTIP